MRVFVYEHLSSGALAGQHGADSLRREGLAMLTAVLVDLEHCSGVQPVALVEPALVSALQVEIPGAETHSLQDNDIERPFRHLARQADFTLVIAPEFDDLLEQRCRWALDEGSRLLGPTIEAIRLTGDKLALAEHLALQGIPTPPTAPCLYHHYPPWPYPVVCKPRFGAGSQHTGRVPHDLGYTAFRDRIDRETGTLREAIVQPWLPGLAASVAFLAGPGQLIAMPAAEQYLSPDGLFSYQGGRVPLPPAFQERAHRLARRAAETVDGLNGYFGIDLVLGPSDDGGDDVVIEINPRLTTSYVGLRRLARDNLMQALLAVILGQPAGPLAWHEAEVRFHADGRID
jgi:predicted ATP-grasp superfamily ATP-dependent carboligase